MKVLKNDLTLEERQIALAFMSGEDEVLFSQYALMAYIMDKLTDVSEDIRVYNEDKSDFSYNLEKVYELKDEFKASATLCTVYMELVDVFKTQTLKNVTVGLASAVNSLVESVNSINTEELTQQLEQTFVNMQKESGLNG